MLLPFAARSKMQAVPAPSPMFHNGANASHQDLQAKSKVCRQSLNPPPVTMSSKGSKIPTDRANDGTNYTTSASKHKPPAQAADSTTMRPALQQQQQQQQHRPPFPPPDPNAALQWLKGRLEGGKQLYPTEEIYSQRQREMVVRFVRFNIFPFEPETVEREFRVGDLIHQIGSVPEHVCQDIYRHLFSSDAPSILPIRPPSLPPAPPALPMAATAAAAALSAADAPSNNNTSNNSNNRNVCRRYSPKLTAQQWIDLLRGYYQARYELRIQHNKHLSTENYCLEIGEGLRVTTLLRKWNASGLEALAQSELDVDHPVVLHCLDEFKKSMEIKGLFICECEMDYSIDLHLLPVNSAHRTAIVCK